MLANLLPGIRDLRTPLATGYIWLLTFWLWIPTNFKEVTPSTGVPGDIARLVHYSGRVGIGIALSFIAYLIGALSGLFNPFLTRIGGFLAWYGRWPRYGVGISQLAVQPLDFWRVYFPSSHGRVDIAARFAIVNARYGRAGFYNLVTAARQMANKTGDEESYLAYLIQEAYAQGNVLLGKEPDLFAAYDRLIAEYEFRIGVTAPLISLILTLAFRWTPLWLLALLPLLLLLRAGAQRRTEAGDVLADAVRQGRLPVVMPPGLPPPASKSAPEST
jgi:hypothetical protein